MKTTILILAMLSSSIWGTTSNTAIIKGKITDAADNSEISFANIQLFQAGKVVSATQSDINGDYILKNLTAGKYSIKITMVGYSDYKMNEFPLAENEQKVMNIKLKASAVPLQEVVSVKDCNKKDKLVARSESYACGGVAYSISGDYAEPEYNTENYDVINENNFKDALTNPLSTFSIDVDRASYANVRRFLNQNQLPMKDAVRIEELVNYFDYEYPQPKDDKPFAVFMEGGACPWNPSHQLVMVGLQGKKVDTKEIPHGNLVFLIDVSGSMSSANKLPLLKQTFKILIENLRDEDKVAIVVYAGAAGCVLESTPGTKKERIREALERLEAGGSTAGGAGINLAYKIAKENFIPGGNNRVILASDGDFNTGASSDAEMVRLIEEKRKEGVYLTILGYGMGNYKDSKMEKLSNAGNGNYYYIDNITEGNKVFGKELWGTLFTIANDVKIQVEFNPNKVKGYRLIGYENRLLNKEDFNDDKKDAGEIGSGHTVTALYEIIPASSDEVIPGTDPLKYQKQQTVSSSEWMTVKIRYKKPGEETSRLMENIMKDNHFTAKSSVNFCLATSVAEFGMLLRDSEHKGQASWKHCKEMAMASKGEDPDGYRQEYIKLVEIASLLSK
jgi:Ca-activated chloride channel family protein